jgi:hypothetical protein
MTQKPMTRRNIFLPEALWNALQEYAIELTVKEGKPVSVSEAMRRILERSLKRRA